MQDPSKIERCLLRELLALPSQTHIAVLTSDHRLYNMWVQVSGMIGANSEYDVSPMDYIYLLLSLSTFGLAAIF